MVASDPGGVFDGPGEVRELIRNMDWSVNPLGPVGSWSPVLRTMVRGCLASSFPMVIHWGPERVALYNDPFAVLLGGKHPAALGRPARETWPEAWEVVGGRLDEVMVHGHTMHAEDEQRVLHRHGYPEECYFSFRTARSTTLTVLGAGVCAHDGVKFVQRICGQLLEPRRHPRAHVRGYAEGRSVHR